MKIDGHKYIRVPNGNIVFINGTYPNEINGYIQSTEEPTLFIQQFPKCIHRKMRDCGECGSPNSFPECKLGLPLDCVNCLKVDPTGIEPVT